MKIQFIPSDNFSSSLKNECYETKLQRVQILGASDESSFF